MAQKEDRTRGDYSADPNSAPPKGPQGAAKSAVPSTYEKTHGKGVGSDGKDFSPAKRPGFKGGLEVPKVPGYVQDGDGKSKLWD